MGAHNSSLVAVDDQIGAATPFSREEQRLLAELLPDFYFPTHSTKNDHRIMIEHWDTLFAQTKQPQPSSGGPTSSPMVMLFDNFYKYLFEMAPQVKPLFRSSMQVQGKALVRIISSIKNMLQSPDLLTFASDLAKRHVKYGIELSYFNVLGVTLMKTLKNCSEEMWTPEREMAWKRVYGHVALIVVMELSKQTAAPRKSSLLMTLSSHRRQSGIDVTLHSLDANRQPIENTKKSSCHHTSYPNARCPMSGNWLKKMSHSPTNHQQQQSSDTAAESDIDHHQSSYSLTSWFSWAFGQHDRASNYTVN
uniref:Globin domain-containing protein n=1 Tax=Globisporangium ultimum (strain ATCC 200006 / CBS 805.95 / DAOM BR144) TaxID=431595 RepID=K3X8K9_GLOUD